jgi:hypothetical protein
VQLPLSGLPPIDADHCRRTIENNIWYQYKEKQPGHQESGLRTPAGKIALLLPNV